MAKNIKYTFSIIIMLAGMSFICGTTYAQTGSLKNLKQSVKGVNDLKNSVGPGDPWTLKNIITPEELAKVVESKTKNKPVILQIGFKFLFNEGHIPGAKYAGPASRKEGIENLKSITKSIPHNKEVVIYCGCCGWTECPNIHPGFKAMKNMGFKNIRLLYMPHNFTQDWVNKGLPVQR